MEESKALETVEKWIRRSSKGEIGHEAEAEATKGLTLLRIHKGFVLCDFLVHYGVSNPAVSECCVLGLPDKTYGEVVCAIIVAEAETKKKREEESKPAITLEELTSWAKDRLAPYKIPTRLFLWDSLPRNAMGKVNKKELKKLLVPEQ